MTTAAVRARRMGRVTLVGAGPGDPGLVTVKGARRLREADVVYHDALVPPAILALCRRDARLVNVGKRRGSHRWSQPMIEALLARDARAGLAVVRLKGGDPFVFGRGGEEALALRARGVPCDVIPGLTSGTSVPALAGIPITHRGLASSAAFVTAHDLSPGEPGDAARERLGHLARGAGTIVVFMAGDEAAGVRDALMAAGLPPETPAAAIENGSRPDQRVTAGALQDLDALASGLSTGPVLLVIGRTVGLAALLGAPADDAGGTRASRLEDGNERRDRRRTG